LEVLSTLFCVWFPSIDHRIVAAIRPLCILESTKSALIPDKVSGVSWPLADRTLKVTPDMHVS
jgi:hypothetical protein